MSFDGAMDRHRNGVFVKQEFEHHENNYNPVDHQGMNNNNNNNAVLPDGCFSLDATATKTTTAQKAAAAATVGGFLVNAEMATLIRQIEDARSALNQHNEEYMTAKLNEQGINQTLSTLTTQRKEIKEEMKAMKAKLQRNNDEIDITKTAQTEAIADTAAKEKKRKATATTLDNLMGQLYRYKEEAAATTISMAPPQQQQQQQQQPRRQSEIFNNKSRLVNNGGGGPRRVGLMSGTSRPREVVSTDHQYYYESSNNRPSKKAKSPTISNVTAMTTQQQRQEKKKKTLTRKDIFKLSADAEAGDIEAKAKLIEIVQKTPRRQLREILDLPSQSHVKSLDSYASLDIMRALVRGQADQRSDLKARLARNPNMKRELLSNRGKLTVGHITDNRQERIIFILDVPELMPC